MEWLGSLKKLDAYPSNKVNEDFFQRSISGGIITIASSILMLCLFISELSEETALGLIHTLCQAVYRSRHTPPAVSHLACMCNLREASLVAGLFMKVTTTNELSVDTSRGDQLQIHVRELHLQAPAALGVRFLRWKLIDLWCCSSTSHSLLCPASGSAWISWTSVASCIWMWCVSACGRRALCQL